MRTCSSQEGASTAPTAASAIDFLRLVTNLKTNKRTGWVLMGVNQPESIADHMYRMGMMALIAGNDSGYDSSRKSWAAEVVARRNAALLKRCRSGAGMSSTINAMFNETVARVTNFKLSADSEITTVIARQVWTLMRDD
ncbi:MAG: hypothetical protein WDW36_006483 [Sanguina aurantia]